MDDIIDEYIGKNVKIPFNDGGSLRVARGKLVKYDGIFLKVEGDLGSIVINKNNIDKISEVKENGQ